MERALALIKQLQIDGKYPELIALKRREISYMEKQRQFLANEKTYEYGDLFLTHYGVCENFAQEYKDLCKRLNLPCEEVRGHILSDGVECGHAWNTIFIDGKLKHVDISAAIHCKDGTNTINSPEDFFAKTFTELTEADHGANRTICETSEKDIKAFISNSEGWNVGD